MKSTVVFTAPTTSVSNPKKPAIRSIRFAKSLGIIKNTSVK